MRNPLVLTRAPLTFAGDASEMYKGALMDAILTPRPTKTLPIVRRAGLGAEALRIFQRERGNQQ